jgi:hypothetical protein
MNEELRKMVEEERLGKGNNEYENKDSKSISRNTNYKHKENLEDQYDEIDEKEEKRKKKLEKINKNKKNSFLEPKMSEEEMLKKKSIQIYNQIEKITENCPRCFETSKTFKDNLVICFSNFCFLSLPSCQPFVDFHCYIVPIHHVSSLLDCDEDVITEITNFKKCLIRLFESLGLRPVFLETCKELTKGKHHTFIEVIPLEEGKKILQSFLFIYF